MPTLEQFVDEVDRLSRRLMRNMECCDRMLVVTCELTAAQAYALLTIEERGPATMNELATEMRLHGTTMTRMVDALVDKGLAERGQDPEDRRIVRVSLTPRGQETVETLRELKRQFLATAFAQLSEDERAAVLKALGRLTSTAEELGRRCCVC